MEPPRGCVPQTHEAVPAIELGAGQALQLTRFSRVELQLVVVLVVLLSSSSWLGLGLGLGLGSGLGSEG